MNLHSAWTQWHDSQFNMEPYLYSMCSENFLLALSIS